MGCSLLSRIHCTNCHVAHGTVTQNQGTPHHAFDSTTSLRKPIPHSSTHRHHSHTLPLVPAPPALPNHRPRPLPPQIYTLFLLAGTLVGVLSGVPFLSSFFSGMCLEIHDIIASRRPVDVDGHLDLIASPSIPTTKRLLGGPRKVVLGASPNWRTSSLWWKFFWIVMVTLQTLFIVLSYFLLGQQKADFVFIWAGFQLFWFVARILIFNLTENTHSMAYRPMQYDRGAIAAQEAARGESGAGAGALSGACSSAELGCLP